MQGYLIPFVAAVVVCSLGFWALDLVVMQMQGLSLIYGH